MELEGKNTIREPLERLRRVGTRHHILDHATVQKIGETRIMRVIVPIQTKAT